MIKRLKLIVFVIFYGLILNSCNKDDNKSIDIRDKYIGNYQVHEIIRSYGLQGFGEQYSRERDTIISVNYGITDSTLNVLGRDVKLDSAGNYSAYHYCLRLWNDSIYSYFMNGGLGFGQKEIYNGYKISNNP